MKVKASISERMHSCYKAGRNVRELQTALSGTHTWIEWKDARSTGSHFQYAGTHASSLSTSLRGEARQVAIDLAKQAKGIRAKIGRKETLTAAEQKNYEKQLFAMRSVAHWLRVSAEAVCGDPDAKFSLRKFKAPPLKG